jgi:hypothetical protein
MSRPTKDEAHVASAGQVDEHQNRQGDFASNPDNGKALATLQAQFALKGFVLASLHDGSLIVERWGFIKALDNITQATQFLQAIGGRI